ncbi:hypothetical protein DBY21_00240 [Candidatus Gastranaerophilales bacterium]|nr:MAG: hypothetical protein DBY21_00240 [Candidatus Gastranaerophilales bacterium]
MDIYNNAFHDNETLRQQRNLTKAQRKTNNDTKEGVLVNSLIKDNTASNPTLTLNDTMDTLVISKSSQMPDKLYEKEARSEKSLVPISGIALGVMGAIAGLTALISHSAKINLNIDSLKRLQPTIRNVAINDEPIQALYRIVECPNWKTITAGTGVFALTAMAFMGKTFFDGFRDVWVKKKEADIQKNLQEKLIDIETQSFAGKIQITRSMLSQKAIELSKYLKYEPQKKQISEETFKALMFKGGNIKNAGRDKKDNNLNYILIGLGTFAGIVGLGFLALKNLTKSKGHIEKFIAKTSNEIKDVVKNAKPDNIEQTKADLKNLFKSIEPSKEKMEEWLKSLDWKDKEAFIKSMVNEFEKSTVDANPHCGGGSIPKTTFYSHVNDFRAFFYNYLLDTGNKQFKALFLGTTGLTAIGYGGKLVGEAVKDVQVKKLNADTEAELQQRLVSTELKNFKSKKDAAIQPLMDEFYKQAREGKPKEELKTMAENILFEIKNGPPFVYS